MVRCTHDLHFQLGHIPIYLGRLELVLLGLYRGAFSRRMFTIGRQSS